MIKHENINLLSQSTVISQKHIRETIFSIFVCIDHDADSNAPLCNCSESGLKIRTTGKELSKSCEELENRLWSG